MNGYPKALPRLYGPVAFTVSVVHIIAEDAGIEPADPCGCTSLAKRLLNIRLSSLARTLPLCMADRMGLRASADRGRVERLRLLERPRVSNPVPKPFELHYPRPGLFIFFTRSAGRELTWLINPRSSFRGSSRNRTYRGPVYSQPCRLDSSTAVVARFNSVGIMPTRTWG